MEGVEGVEGVEGEAALSYGLIFRINIGINL